MEVIKIARIPPVTVPPQMTVLDALSLMAELQVGAVVATDSDRKVVGIFTERDNLNRVSVQRRDVERTLIRDVMTTPVETIGPKTDVTEALERMIRGRFRHFPVTDDDRHVVGIVSLRYLLMHRLSEEKANAQVWAAYMTAGGPG
jgi:CBS domain-containing protein